MPHLIDLDSTLTAINHLSYFPASGNDGKSGLKYPAAHPTVIAVGALSSDYSLWSGSNWGSGSELVAPGNSVLSTTVNGKGQSVYSLYSGTSMATPHVAGVAVRLSFSLQPDMICLGFVLTVSLPP
jgi:subtilisin family serine protease